MLSLSIILGINEGDQIVTNEGFNVSDLKTLLFKLKLSWFYGSSERIHSDIFLLN